MYDVWDVIGLRGTGTNSYSVDNLFIPEKFVALRDDPAGCAKKVRSTPSRHRDVRTGLRRDLGRRRPRTLDAMIELARGKARSA